MVVDIKFVVLGYIFWFEVDKGMFLVGLLGIGKIMLVCVVLKDMGFWFFYGFIFEWFFIWYIFMYIVVIRNFFMEVWCLVLIIVFIDEFDLIGNC